VVCAALVAWALLGGAWGGTFRAPAAQR
jgi:hypothetical protein